MVMTKQLTIMGHMFPIEEFKKAGIVNDVLMCCCKTSFSYCSKKALFYDVIDLFSVVSACVERSRRPELYSNCEQPELY